LPEVLEALVVLAAGVAAAAAVRGLARARPKLFVRPQRPLTYLIVAASAAGAVAAVQSLS